jgi:hypothetical protein
MKAAKPLFVASWVLLLILTILIAFAAATSTATALGGGQENLTPTVSLDQLSDLGPEVATAIRGRRATAATWALAYAILMSFVVLVPYRRGELWAWWALLLSLGLSQLVSIARVPALGAMSQGAGTAGILLAFALIGLLAGAPYLFSRRGTAVNGVH